MRISASHIRALLCALLLVICVLIARPFAETGLDDDFSYIYSARALAQTGHIHYVGWASAMLGWQLALGALFVKLFGFSFSIVRSSILLVAALTTVLLHRVFVRLGLTESNATLATLAVMLSPLSLSLAFTFMSDMSGTFCTVACMYLCLRALQADRDSSSAAWLAAACVVTGVGGTARQTVWLCLFVMVPSTFFLIRRRRLPVALLAAIWVASVGFAYASLRWFSHQIYSIRELPIAGYIDRDLVYHLLGQFFCTGVQVAMFVLPVLLALLPMFPVKNKRAWAGIGGVVFLLILGEAYAIRLHEFAGWLPPFKGLGNFVSSVGMIDVPEIGKHVIVVPIWAQLLLLALILAGLCGLAGLLLQRPRHRAGVTTTAAPTWRQLLILVLPFTAAYLALVLHRALFADAYDRYFMPLLPILLALIIRLYQERSVQVQLPRYCYAVIALFALLGIGGLHDAYAERRARVQAGERLIAAGIPRTSFYAGFEYDGWTQIEQVGYMNVGYMVWPDGVHVLKPITRRMVLKPCDQHFAQNVPAIQPKYGISYDQVACDGPSQFAPEAFQTWLPPYDQKLYIRTVTRQAF